MKKVAKSWRKVAKVSRPFQDKVAKQLSSRGKLPKCCFGLNFSSQSGLKSPKLVTMPSCSGKVSLIFLQYNRESVIILFAHAHNSAKIERTSFGAKSFLLELAADSTKLVPAFTRYSLACKFRLQVLKATKSQNQANSLTSNVKIMKPKCKMKYCRFLIARAVNKIFLQSRVYYLRSL